MHSLTTIIRLYLQPAVVLGMIFLAYKALEAYRTLTDEERQ